MAWFNQTLLRAEIVKAAQFIRQELMARGCDERFTLSVEVAGSADKADATLKFKFDTSRNYGSSVTSPHLADAVDEFLRRRGFDKKHEAELLTYDPDEAEKLSTLQAPIPAPPEPQN
jgi:hypothetical protein